MARNPLERPSIEQARQGISAIRRFFGIRPTRAGDADKDALDEPAREKARELINEPAKRPLKSMLLMWLTSSPQTNQVFLPRV